MKYKETMYFINLKKRGELQSEKNLISLQYFWIVATIFAAVKVGIHLYNSAYNLNCRKYLTNCSNV